MQNTLNLTFIGSEHKKRIESICTPNIYSSESRLGIRRSLYLPGTGATKW